MYNNILTETLSDSFIITINRESKLNALNIETLSEIKKAVESVQNEKNILGIIITGAGKKAFAAGADISEFANFTPDQAKKMSKEGHDVMFTIENSLKPVVSAVNGFALGGGCELAMSCHIRFASENAKFGQPEVNLGVPPGYGGTQRLIQLIGKSKAMELLMTAEVISANSALEYGLVSEVVPVEDIVQKSIDFLQKLRSKSPMAIAKVIKCVNDCINESTNGFETEINEFSSSFQTPEFKEGTEAFLNKRTAQFYKNNLAQ